MYFYYTLPLNVYCSVATALNVPWIVIYDFIMDRLRAVRQDMVIQNLSAADSISLLQPMIRFYALAAYR